MAMIGPAHVVADGAGDRPDSFELIDGDARNPVFALAGTAVDCVHVALGAGLAGHVDVVITGLRGADDRAATGCDSGSDAAACEAALMGRPALSVASHGATAESLRWAGTVVADLAAWLLASPAPVRSFVRLSIPSEIGHRALKLAGVHPTGKDHDGHIRIEPVNLEPAAPAGDLRLAAWAEETIAAINPRLGVSDGSCLAGCCG